MTPPAQQPVSTESPAVSPGTRIRRRELLWFLIVGVGGALILPPAIYLVGTRTLGAYEGGGIFSFIGAVYGDLIRLHPAAYALLFGPYALLCLLRALIQVIRAKPAAEPVEPEDED